VRLAVELRQQLVDGIAHGSMGTAECRLASSGVESGYGVHRIRKGPGPLFQAARQEAGPGVVQGAQGRVRSDRRTADESADRRSARQTDAAVQAIRAAAAKVVPHLPRHPLLEGQESVQD